MVPHSLTQRLLLVPLSLWFSPLLVCRGCVGSSDVLGEEPPKCLKENAWLET